jgi:hypothetical protein
MSGWCQQRKSPPHIVGFSNDGKIAFRRNLPLRM